MAEKKKRYSKMEKSICKSVVSGTVLKRYLSVVIAALTMVTLAAEFVFAEVRVAGTIPPNATIVEAKAVAGASTALSMKKTISFTTGMEVNDKKGEPGAMNLAKIFHAQPNTPLTWLIGGKEVRTHADLFRQWHNDYGDEIGVNLLVFEKPFLEKLGIQPSGKLYSGPYHAIFDYSYEDQLAQVRFLKKHVGETIGVPVNLISNLWNNSDTIKACEAAGYETYWAHCWHQQGVDNATFRGGLWYPFYQSAIEPKAPRQASEPKPAMVAAFWVISDLVNSYHLGVNVPTALHAFEQMRNGVPRDIKYGERLLRECYKQAQWNDFVHLNIHMESVWAHGEPLELFKEWFALCQEMGVRVVTQTEFSRWFKKNYKSTPTQVWHFTDVLADCPTVLKGKERAYADMLFYGSQKRRMVFSQDRGPLPIELIRYDLEHQVEPSKPYPVATLPRVQVTKTEVKRCRPLEVAVQLESQDELEEFAIAVWGLELREPIDLKGIQRSNNVRFLKILDGVGSMVIGFDLKKGTNTITLKQSGPAS